MIAVIGEKLSRVMITSQLESRMEQDFTAFVHQYAYPFI